MAYSGALRVWAGMMIVLSAGIELWPPNYVVAGWMKDELPWWEPTKVAGGGRQPFLGDYGVRRENVGHHCVCCSQ